MKPQSYHAFVSKCCQVWDRTFEEGERAERARGTVDGAQQKEGEGTIRKSDRGGPLKQCSDIYTRPTSVPT
eukprot:130493-Pyramimonas_sp.AAC.1